MCFMTQDPFVQVFTPRKSGNKTRRWQQAKPYSLSFCEDYCYLKHFISLLGEQTSISSRTISVGCGIASAWLAIHSAPSLSSCGRASEYLLFPRLHNWLSMDQSQDLSVTVFWVHIGKESIYSKFLTVYLISWKKSHQNLPCAEIIDLTH